MPFNVQTCITNLGNRQLAGPIDIYVNNSFVIPISSVTLTQVTQNCPFTVSVPDNTTSITLTDRPTRCSLTMPIQSNNFCPTCDFDFNQATNVQVGLISAGSLTAACQSNLTDYKINWYGPGLNSNNLVFSSGLGNQFDYQYTHPLTGNRRIPVQEGIYSPKLVNVVLNGIEYSATGGTGNVLADLDCIGRITINPYKCDNRTNTVTSYPFSAYNHSISFAASSGIAPQPVSLTYIISASTKFLAISFDGKSVTDRITLKLSGASYPNNLIGLEDWIVGGNSSGWSVAPTTIPKIADTEFAFNKIVCLTGLTINNNDKIIITITPSVANTDWDFYFTCINNFDYDCSLGCIDTNSYKIIGNTINSTTTTCGVNIIRYNVSGCTQDNNLGYFKYYQNGINFLYTNYVFGLITGTSVGAAELTFGTQECRNDLLFSRTTNCVLDASTTIYNNRKVNGRNVFEFSGSSTFISSIFNSWKSAVDQYWTNPPNTSLDYYSYYSLIYPNTNHPNNCGDPTDQYSRISLHPTCNYSSGITQNQYFFRITANTITRNITLSECDLRCNLYVDNMVSLINGAATGSSYAQIVFNPGIRYNEPVPIGYKVKKFTLSPKTKSTTSGGIHFFDFISSTYPFSGTTNTIIPNLSGTVCNYNQKLGLRSSFFGDNVTFQYKYSYETRLPNQNRPEDFEIWASPIVNGVPLGFPNNTQYVLAYRFSGGSVTFSSSTYII